MRTYFLLVLSLSVVYSLPVQELAPVAPEEDRRPLLRDVLPKQGHVVQEDPEPVVLKETLVQVEQVKSNPGQQNNPVKMESVEELVPVVQEEKAQESQEQIEPVEESVMDEAKDQEAALMVQMENGPLSNMGAPEMVEDELLQQELPEEQQEEPLDDAEDFRAEELEPEYEEALAVEERNLLQEEAAQMDEGRYFSEDEPLLEPESEAEMVDLLEEPVEVSNQMDPAMEPEVLEEELLLQDSLQSDRELAEPEMLEPLPGDEELMMSDQSPLEDPLMNDQVTREEMPYSDEGRAKSTVQLCNGVVIAGKCYEFFAGPSKPADAEFYCQDNFYKGHLASVTNSFINLHMMKLMDKNGGRRRTWIGGLRYLDTGRFIWLDGARWSYANWLSGEPNNSAGVENCVELLSTGKFNDFRCSDLQPFICSYPYYRR